MFSHNQIYAADDQNNATEGGFYTGHGWPCFTPRWYKTHYASHYLGVRTPHNEMIHIQEGYLRLHFFFSPQTTTCIKVLFLNRERVMEGWEVGGCLIPAQLFKNGKSIRGWPSPPPNASPDCCQSKSGVSHGTRVFGMKYTFNKAACPPPPKGQAKILWLLFWPPCSSVKHEGVKGSSRVFSERLHKFRSSAASISRVIAAFDRRFVGVWENYTWTPALTPD